MSFPRKYSCESGKATYRTVGYLRLSKEDEQRICGSDGTVQSNSIINQRTLIEDYARRCPQLEMVGCYLDDGISGAKSDFEGRPGFQRMMEEIRDGRIDCVIVKDFSRLGRNHTEVGRYMDIIFPFLQIRFISILDDYDSIKKRSLTDYITIPFKNLVNETYCRDASLRIKSHMAVKRERGEFIGAFAPYGYKKDPCDKNRLIVDDYAAGVVAEIFRLRLGGMSCGSISRLLNERGEPSPAEYRQSMGSGYKSNLQTHQRPGWYAETVRRITANEVYTGVLEQGKSQKTSYKTDDRVVVPREQRSRIPNSHQAIIPREIFALAAGLDRRDTRTTPGLRTVYPFSGLIFCARCGSAAYRKATSSGKKEYAYYRCGGARRGQCSIGAIGAVALEAAVLEAIKTQMLCTVDMRRLFSAAAARPVKNHGLQTARLQLENREEEQRRCKLLLGALECDRAEGLLTDGEYEELRLLYQQRCTTAETGLERLETEIEAMERAGSEKERWLGRLRERLQIDSLPRELLIRLVERVCICGSETLLIMLKFRDEPAQLFAGAQGEV